MLTDIHSTSRSPSVFPLCRGNARIYGYLLAANVVAWAWALIALHHDPTLLGTVAALAAGAKA